MPQATPVLYFLIVCLALAACLLAAQLHRVRRHANYLRHAIAKLEGGVDKEAEKDHPDELGGGDT